VGAPSAGFDYLVECALRDHHHRPGDLAEGGDAERARARMESRTTSVRLQGSFSTSCSVADDRRRDGAKSDRRRGCRPGRVPDVAGLRSASRSAGRLRQGAVPPARLRLGAQSPLVPDDAAASRRGERARRRPRPRFSLPFSSYDRHLHDTGLGTHLPVNQGVTPDYTPTSVKISSDRRANTASSPADCPCPEARRTRARPHVSV
jgi:hypothetical protein